jgi:hypothetical protein
LYKNIPIRQVHLCQKCIAEGIDVDMNLEFEITPQTTQMCRDRLKTARKTEQDVARRIGGITQAASGALRCATKKADVRKRGEWLVEVKYTDAKKYQLQHSDLMKIGRAAAITGENPAFVVTFNKQKDSYAVLPMDLFEEFVRDKSDQD